jgi:hypothetical protein
MKESVTETGKNIMWLIDARLSPVFQDEDVQWVIHDWTPRALTGGVTHMVFILPQIEWAAMGIDNYNDEASKAGMKVAYLADVESAKTWFMEYEVKIS